MSVVIKVLLTQPITGAQVMAAVKDVAGSSYFEKPIATGLYRIGKKDPSDGESLVIEHGSEHIPEFNLNDRYTSLYVKVNSTNEGISSGSVGEVAKEDLEEAQKFLNQLQAKLNS